jgi:2-keto-4-pentenoate hydratase
MSASANREPRTRWAEALARASETTQPLAPPSESDGGLSLADAYAIQQLGVERRLASGARLVGRKVGLTSPAVQAQLGVQEPDYGALLDDMEVPDGGSVERAKLLAPRVEAEVAFVLAEPLEGPGVDVAAVERATDYVLAAIEIVDSRIADWRITLADTVADNASSALFVLGTQARRLDELDVAGLDAVLLRDGEEVERGNTALVLGDPRAAVAWLANTLSRLGSSLRAGDVVLSGACTRMVDAVAGARYTARIEGLGEVEVNFTEEGR